MGKWEKRVGMTTRAITRPPGSPAPRPGLPGTDSQQFCLHTLHIISQHCDYALETLVTLDYGDTCDYSLETPDSKDTSDYGLETLDSGDTRDYDPDYGLETLNSRYTSNYAQRL